MQDKRETIYVIQPIETPEYKILHTEIVALIESAGADYAGTIYQNIRSVNPATYIGEGKLEELANRLSGLDVTVLFNGDLSPSQSLNISAALGGKKVIDRTTLILDIFALRAVSSEGKIQVELAQLKYLYPRLKGKGEALSRLGGGIGTRGPGETQLETDRRHIRTRIRALEQKLSETEKRRALQTARRKKERIKTIALDPTARTFEIEGVPFLLVDTVGFLQNLPHRLIEAFHSTLESALNCDLALIVCDAAGEFDMQLKTTLETLHELNFASPYLVVMNKSDLVNAREGFPKDSVQISAKNGTGLDKLKTAIMSALQNEFVRTKLFIPYEKTAQYGAIRNLLTESKVTYLDNGSEISAIIPAVYAERFREFFIK